MTWNKTDDTAVAPDQPASSWLANRMATNTDDHTRESLTWACCVCQNTYAYLPGASAGWIASSYPRPFPVWVTLSPETDEITITIRGTTRKASATVDVEVGYGLSAGRDVAWTPAQTFTTGALEELTYTLSLDAAHLDQLKEIPLLFRITSNESTDPADIDIGGGFAIQQTFTAFGTAIAPLISPWWTLIEDETALGGYGRNDCFAYSFSGVRDSKAFVGATYSSRPMTFYADDNEGTTAALYCWPQQDADLATSVQQGVQEIHLTLLGALRIHAIEVVQSSPASPLPYPGVQPSPLSDPTAALQAVAPDMPTRYQPDLLAYRAQKYLVAYRPPILSVGPSAGAAFAPTAFDNPGTPEAQSLIHIPLDQSPTTILSQGVQRSRTALDVVLWLTAWTGLSDANDAIVRLDYQLLEIDQTVLGVPATQPTYNTVYSETVSVSPQYTDDPDSFRRRVKGFRSDGTQEANPTHYVALAPLWENWRHVLRSVTRVEARIQDDTPGNVHDYLRITLTVLGPPDADESLYGVQAVGWVVTEAGGEIWDQTTEAV